MIIKNSAVALASRRAMTVQYSRREALEMWVGDRSPTQPATSNVNASSPPAPRDRVEISASAVRMAAERFQAKQEALQQAKETTREALRDALQPEKGEGKGRGRRSTGVNDADEKEGLQNPASLMDELELNLLRLLMRTIFGRRGEEKMRDPTEDPLNREAMEQAASDANATAAAIQQAHAAGQATAAAPESEAAPQEPAGWGLVYDYQESYLEAEHLSFSATGVVQTADGQQIAFETQLSMSRVYMENHEVHLRAGDAVLKDPLVINFAGTAAQLSKTRFDFDLDADGQTDKVALATGGSAFLALDKNGDGQVNDGSELFGPRSGDGFADLRVHDQDNNGWIDEADPVFRNLRLWNRDEAGNDRVMTLQDQGIGAIHLGAAQAAFSLKDDHNLLVGQARQAGVFLRDNGAAGTVQQIDLAV
ncbi:MAG: hypothetical protein HQL51_01200 [Magnetococcales bacterium]|nr:hypothetical protein [Magnetococcales bacterium]